jgi:NADH-quinone oxidoreductase subunit C
VTLPPRRHDLVLPEGVTSAEADAQADLDALAAGFATLFGSDVHASRDAAGTPCIDVDRSRWLRAALHARDRIGMTFFDWLSAVDDPDADPPGLQVVAHVVVPMRAGGPVLPVARTGGSTDGSGAVHEDRVLDGSAAPPAPAVRRLLLRTTVPNGIELLSLTSVWPGAAWHERETFEMFGLVFAGFEDGTDHGLRPLLLPDGFEGTPLRKSFVLAARAAKAWPGAKEPGESDSATTPRSPGRRKVAPPGVPDPVTWGPREPEPAPAADLASEVEPSADAEGQP